MKKNQQQRHANWKSFTGASDLFTTHFSVLAYRQLLRFATHAYRHRRECEFIVARILMKLLILPFTGRSLSYHRFMSKIFCLLLILSVYFFASENQKMIIAVMFSFRSWNLSLVSIGSQIQTRIPENKIEHYFDEMSLHWPIGIWQGDRKKKKEEVKNAKYELTGCT